jgi:hypothetical protein
MPISLQTPFAASTCSLVELAEARHLKSIMTARKAHFSPFFLA